MKKAVIYARYSSDAQTEQSIEGQLRECQNYAKHNDILIVDTYIDRAMTGTNDNRAAFQKMIRDSAKKQWEIVLVYKLDRFSRNKFETVIHRKTLQDNGVRLVSAMEKIPDTPEGALMETVLEGLNQYYSEELRQKVNRGLRESWIKGQATGGKHILGYDIVEKKYVINEREAALVRELFERYANQETAPAIAAAMTAAGKLRPEGQPFEQYYIYKILHDKRYTGVVEHQGVLYDNIFPQIITSDLWQRVESIYNENRLSPSRKKDKFDYILSEKMICGVCKRKKHGICSTGRHGGHFGYYSCKGKKDKREICSCKPIRKEYIEDLVVNTTIRLLTNEDEIMRIAEKILETHERQTRDNATLKLLMKKRNETYKAEQNVMKAIEQGIINDMTRQRFSELEVELAQIDIAIEREKQRAQTDLTLQQVIAFLKSDVLVENPSMEVKKIIIRTFVRSVIVYPDSVTIVYNFAKPTEHIAINAAFVTMVEKTLKKAEKEGAFLLTQCPPPKIRRTLCSKRAEGSSFYNHFASFSSLNIGTNDYVLVLLQQMGVLPKNGVLFLSLCPTTGKLESFSFYRINA